MDRLWNTHDHTPMGMDRDWERAGCAGGHILRSAGLDVSAELRARGLGYT